ncbi:FAD-dependent oxidoreductase [Knoellia sp. CPCC 206453]|uniref:FAD-dependent oxidoreductase n=1 Tax=Knoellia pratensis TaxID=3404796 RepID=UPI00361A53CA
MSADRPTDRPAGLVDLVVLGAGPAGLTAADIAATGGLTVALVDSGHALGGQFWRHPPSGSEISGTERFHHDLTAYRRLVANLERHAASGRLVLRLGHHAWTAAVVDEGVELHLVDRRRVGEEQAVVVRGRRLLVATGAHDLQLPFPGWDLPGVFTAGGLQALLKGSGVAGGRRVVVAGTGPFLLPVAVGLADAKARVVGVHEANDPRRWLSHATSLARLPGKAVEGAGYAASLLKHRIPVHVRSAVVAAHGDDRVEAVTVARLDRTGVVVEGTQRQIVVDAVGVGWGFTPQLDLAVTLGCQLASSEDGNCVVAVDEWQRTSVSGVLAAGETCGVGGAVLAALEGRLAAEGLLRDVGSRSTSSEGELRRVRRAVTRHRAFARAMRMAHPVPSGWASWLDSGTTVCRCEEVTAGAVADVVDAGARDGRQVKQLTRAGMGWCQGRICGFAIECLARGSVPGVADPAVAAERLVAAPVLLGTLAAPTTNDPPDGQPSRSSAM